MASDLAIPRKLWTHPEPTSTHMYKFTKAAEKATRRSFPDYNSLHQWSCRHRSEFWFFAFQYFPLVYTGHPSTPVVDESARIDTVPRWFPGIKLNFAENVLFLGDGHGRQTKSPGKEDEKIACTGVREGSFLEPITQTTWKALRERVGRLSQALRTHHVQKGDRVALVASTCLDTLTVFLAVTTIGAISSSSSPDMGTTAILDRLKQIEPKYLFMEDYAVYNTKQTDLRPKMREILNGMKGVAGFRGVISQSRFPGKPADISSIPHCQTWETFISKAPSSTLIFEQLDFSDPMIIVYSSGTTGQPKCIAHSVGGIVLSGWKESTLHRNVDHTSIQLQYTTTGWIMYMSSIQLLLMGARTVMYDGSPFAHDKSNFIRLVGEQKVTHLGISPRLMQTLQTSDIAPRDVTNLDALQMVTSTGMVLSDALFEWFYAAGFPKQVHLANISGGTDIAAAFGTANPLLPVYVGGCQCIALGMAVEVFDPASAEDAQDAPPPGRPVPADGVPGDLVCTAAFPTMPTRFWGDLAPSDRRSKYHGSYFDKYDGVWTHGDFVMVHPVTKQVFLLGRADGVLNPSGVRFGSAEIYGVVERGFADSVAESLCVGQRRPQDHDESVMLFLLMKPGREKDFTPELVARLKATIRQQLSPRHVPRYVFRTPEIPYTVNAKKVELPVKQIVSGQVVKPSASLANPRCLEYYYQFAKDENLAGLPELKPKL